MKQNGKIELRNITKYYGKVKVLDNINLEIKQNEFFAFLGPSGSGKTTTLRILAGLEELDQGKIFFDDLDVTNTSPGSRDIAMVFQSYALYPHMTVYENISFPLKMDGIEKTEISELVKKSATKVKIQHLLERKPGQLSGGQQQRVALARAVVRQPKFFLLDEPLSNLDAKLRLETRVELKNLHKSLNVTTVYVTHDQEEAMTLANRMAVFLKGKIMQVGTPTDIFDNPKTLEVAGFIGNPPMNLIDAEISNKQLIIAGIKIKDYELKETNLKQVVAGIRPTDLNISNEGIPAKLYLTEQLGDSSIMNLIINNKIVKLKTMEKKQYNDGSNMFIKLNPGKIYLFDPKTGLRI
jgi:ABC-type sugar transport system ATPase subunit|tara:strand:+ start:1204 stop:2259 length:1056 start_codon:yes stop_codon:yes gene_type:complete